MKKDSIKKQNNKNDDDDYALRDEYDFSEMTILPKGRFSPERRAGQNILILAPDLAKTFPNDDAINEALRFLLRVAQMPAKSA